MKKMIVLIALCLTGFHSVEAQTWEEWFQQKKTQKKYLLQQIAALQIYIGYARKGYDIANKGLNTIKEIKNGDFNLHNSFFTSLKNVNPKINRYAKAADIIAYQVRILKNSRHTIASIKLSGQLTTNEINYCNSVFNNLLDDCSKTIDELTMVATSGRLEMKDDERLQRIERLYADMQDKYSFCSSFSDEIKLLSAQRLGEETEIKYSKIINGIK